MELGMFTTCMAAMQQWGASGVSAIYRAVHEYQQRLLRWPQDPHSAVREAGRCGYQYQCIPAQRERRGLTFSYLMIFVMKFLG